MGAAALGAVLQIGTGALWHLTLLSLGVGVVTYVAVFVVTAHRLKQIGEALQHMRRREFDQVEALSGGGRDELGVLIRQVHRTGHALEEEIDSLEQMENYRREFVGNVSHELKTPIFSIQGFAETLLNGALEDSSVNRSFVEKIQRNAERLHNLASDLTEISRIETRSLQMEMAPFDVAGLTDDVLETIGPVAEEKDVRLRRVVPEDLPSALGDRERIQQVLINLVENAVKYNEAGGFVEVRAAQASSGEITFAVEDNGIGVAHKDVPRLTERFYRVDRSRSRSEGGTGLGLAIVKHILGGHDRTLQVKSTPGEGSVFSFSLPTG